MFSGIQGLFCDESFVNYFLLAPSLSTWISGFSYIPECQLSENMPELVALQMERTVLVTTKDRVGCVQPFLYLLWIPQSDSHTHFTVIGQLCRCEEGARVWTSLLRLLSLHFSCTQQMQHHKYLPEETDWKCASPLLIAGFSPHPLVWPLGTAIKPFLFLHLHHTNYIFSSITQPVVCNILWEMTKPGSYELDSEQPFSLTLNWAALRHLFTLTLCDQLVFSLFLTSFTQKLISMFWLDFCQVQFHHHTLIDSLWIPLDLPIQLQLAGLVEISHRNTPPPPHCCWLKLVFIGMWYVYFLF